MHLPETTSEFLNIPVVSLKHKIKNMMHMDEEDIEDSKFDDLFK
jgi:hypothetical protein